LSEVDVVELIDDFEFKDDLVFDNDIYPVGLVSAFQEP
jgi:hypothetical protein